MSAKLDSGTARARGTNPAEPVVQRGQNNAWREILDQLPHQQVVLTVPKRLRPYFLYDRSLLGELSRVAARTVTSFIRATVGEKHLSVGIVSSIQTHGSLANRNPHLHMLVTDGGFWNKPVVGSALVDSVRSHSSGEE